MHVSALPKDAKKLAVSANSEPLRTALQHALGEEAQFNHYVPIMGAERSGRLFSVKPIHGETIFLPMTAENGARELTRYASDARYDPDDGPTCRDDRKGWEVHSTVIDGAPAAIAWAKWTSD